MSLSTSTVLMGLMGFLIPVGAETPTNGLCGDDGPSFLLGGWGDWMG